MIKEFYFNIGIKLGFLNIGDVLNIQLRDSKNVR
jgi:hypothetical protein